MARRYLLFSLGTLLAVSHAIFAADEKKPPPKTDPNLVIGHLDDDKLALKAPALGVIVDREEYEDLVKAWQVKKPFEVDFDKHLVIVATTQGASIRVVTEVKDQNLTVTVMGTADLKPGFWYALKRTDRGDIKTVNGKPLPRK